ncbi:hypothetical protein DPMN_157259 [Dreissena polymorpha]|uniref:Uncharacterized protein n=1 Tax=Dreissena polymorpha TaxID=45954 RepID=A0A9D4EJ08_DREPO|nr:hypothetical protein DPMN_157259 [Dreissena polymorpha]
MDLEERPDKSGVASPQKAQRTPSPRKTPRTPRSVSEQVSKYELCSGKMGL